MFSPSCRLYEPESGVCSLRWIFRSKEAIEVNPLLILAQGSSLEDLKEHLHDLYKDLSSGAIPNVRQHSELELA